MTSDVMMNVVIFYSDEKSLHTLKTAIPEKVFWEVTDQESLDHDNGGLYPLTRSGQFIKNMLQNLVRLQNGGALMGWDMKIAHPRYSKLNKEEVKSVMRGKNPTKKQKILLADNKLKAENWLILKEYVDKLEISHKASRKVRIIKK